MSRSGVVRLVLLGLMAAIVVLTYAAIVWTLPLGFDVDDEAFGYVLIASDRVATDVPLGFQHLLHPIWMLAGQSVLVFRILRLLGYVVLGLTLVSFGWAITRRLGIRVSRSGWAFVLLIAQVGTFMAYSYPPRYPGYNELTSWFVQLGIALIVLTLSWAGSAARRQGAFWVPWLVWAALGALTVLLLFAKVTSAMAFGMILAAALVIPSPDLRLWKRCASVVTGALGVLLVLWVSGAPITDYLSNSFRLVFSKSAQASFGHPVSMLLSIYWDSVTATGRDLLPALVVFAVAMATFSRRAPSEGDGARGAVIDRIAWIFGAILVIALVTLPKVGAWHYLGDLIVFIGTAGLIGLSTVGWHGVRMRGSTAGRAFLVAFAGCAMVAGPVITAAGTINPITGQFVFSATLWTVLLGIALVLLTQRATLLRSKARGLPALIGCLVIVLSAVSVKADIEKPYRNEALLSQQTSTSAPELRGLRLTAADAGLASWISAAGRSLHADGIPATATGHPGDLLAFNHSGYASPWVGTKTEGPYLSLSDACRKRRPADFFVLQRGAAMNGYPLTHTKLSLALCGIAFPGDFTVAARRASADPKTEMTIWRLKKSVGSG